MKTFRIGDKRYHLFHNNEDDSRTIVDLDDEIETPLLKIDRNLRIYSAKDQVLGSIRSSGDQWVLTEFSSSMSTPLCSTGNQHDWRNLLHAEIQAAIHFLTQE